MLSRTAVILAALVSILALGIKKAGLFWNAARSIPLGTFWQTPGFTLDRMPDLSGKVAVVTGANSGIGKATALQLALANATVVLACRDVDACRRTSTELSSEAMRAGAAGLTRALQLDLLDLKQVEAFAARALEELPALHILVNNAGIATKYPHTISVDDVEATFQANYLGHFWLTKRLLPLLEKSAPARIVHLSSGAHRGAPPEGLPLSRAAVNDAKAIGPYARYGMAKLASLVFAKEVDRRSRDKGILSNAVHPGVVATSMLRADNFDAMLGPWLGPIALGLARLRNRLFAYSPETAALTLLHCAADPSLRAGGELFVPVATPWKPWHAQADNATFARELWRFSDELVFQSLR